jgi:hypothetical protein
MPFIAVPLLAAASSAATAAAGAVAGASALTIGSTAATVAGAGMSFFGQRQQAAAAKQSAAYNSKIALDQAKYESSIAGENARRRQTANDEIIAQQRAAIATSGFAPTGTPLAQLGDSASKLQQEIFDLGHAAAVRSSQLISESSMTLWQGAQQSKALNDAAWAGLLSDAGKTAGSFIGAKGLAAPTQDSP